MDREKKVYEALITLADFLGMTENEVASNVSMFDKEMFQKIKIAVDKVNAFNALPMKEMVESMGYSYEERTDGSFVVSGVL
jgi:hypothetical protein